MSNNPTLQQAIDKPASIAHHSIPRAPRLTCTYKRTPSTNISYRKPRGPAEAGPSQGSQHKTCVTRPNAVTHVPCHTDRHTERITRQSRVTRGTETAPAQAVKATLPTCEVCPQGRLWTAVLSREASHLTHTQSGEVSLSHQCPVSASRARQLRPVYTVYTMVKQGVLLQVGQATMARDWSPGVLKPRCFNVSVLKHHAHKHTCARVCPELGSARRQPATATCCRHTVPLRDEPASHHRPATS